MTMQEAIQQMLQGKKVKLPEWVGYWFMEDKEIKVFTKNREVLNTPWFDKYHDRVDFEIAA